MKHLLTAATMCLASPLAAQAVYECDWEDSLQAIVEPWEENTRTYSNGAVRLVNIDVGAPAAGSNYLIILTPPYLEMGERYCFVVAWREGLGFAGLHFQDITASYDPEQGLLFDVPIIFYDQDLDFANSALMTVSVNQATSQINTSLELGAE